MSDIPISLFIPLVSLILIWLTIVTVVLFKIKHRYQKLTKGVNKQNLSAIVEYALSELDVSKKDLVAIARRCDKIEQEGLFHAQKIGLLRFNPFSDTGGDQSFILVILNGRDDGILLSSLHGRTGTRWYAKRVKEGKGVEHELTSEEKTAIKNAKIIS